MKNIKVYVKNFSDIAWQDVTKATLSSKMSLRKGFSSLGKGSDVGKLSITFKADDLAAAAVFHTTAKQIRIIKAGRNVFEGYTEGSAKVKSTASSTLAWIQLSAYPYSHMAESGKVAEDHTFFDHKILDPADPAHSLVHKLVDLVWSTVPEKYRSILPTLPEQKIITNLSITKVLPLMVIEADDKPLDILDDLLAEYGIARYMETLQMVLLEPYAKDSRVPYALEYNDILSEPSIKSAPYVVTKRCVVNLGKIVEKGPETVYMLDDDDGAEGWAEEFVPHGGVWPKDQDVMEASYGTSSETDDLELFYATGLSYELKATEGADIRAEKANLKGTSAEFKFKNHGSADAYIWQVKVNAERTFYRDYSYVTQDEELRSEEAEDIDSIYMVDADDAAHYIRTYRAEKKAESQRISISSGKIAFTPGDLITLGNIPYTILVRYVEDNILTDQIKAECVVYEVREIVTTGKVQSGSAIGGGISYITLALSGSAYRYKPDGTLSDFSATIRATVRRYGTMETPHWYVNGQEVVGVTSTSIDVSPSYMEDRSYITVEVTVGRFRSSGYIYRINDGSSPIIQYRYSDSNTEPPLISGGIWLFRGMPFFFKGTAFGELDSFNWSPNPLPLEGAPYKWMRTSTDGGDTWVYSCITGKDGEPAQNFSIMAEQTTYPLSSRGVMLEDVTRRIFIDRQNLPQTEVCTWAVTPAALQPEAIVGDSITLTIPKGSNYTSITVQANIASFGARILILSGVRAGSPQPEYFGDGYTLEQLQGMATSPSGEPWVNGDNAVVVLRTTEPDGTIKTDPIPYVYEDSTKTWNPLRGTEQNYSKIISDQLADIIKQPGTKLTNTAVMGFFQQLGVFEAFIRFLRTYHILMDPGDFHFEISGVDANGNLLEYPIFNCSYKTENLFSIDFSIPRVMIGDYFGSGGVIWDARDKLLSINGSGNFRGQLDTITLQTLLGGDTFYPKGDINNMDTLLSVLDANVNMNTQTPCSCWVNGEKIMSVVYGDIREARTSVGHNAGWPTVYYGNTCVWNCDISLWSESGRIYKYTARKIATYWNLTPGPTPNIYPAKPSFHEFTQKPDEYLGYGTVPGNQTDYAFRKARDAANRVGSPKSFPYAIPDFEIVEKLGERLYIHNLPTQMPAESDRVWRDSSGSLKIS